MKKDTPEHAVLNIRRATTEDIGLLHDMANIAFPATYREILTAAQIDYMMVWMYAPESLLRQMTEEGHIYYMVFHGNTPAGYASIQPEGECTFHLQKLYVLPDFQGMGIGKHLFLHAQNAVKELCKAPCEMRLNVNRKNIAINFYEHMGMKKVDEGDFPIGGGFFMNDYIMSLTF